MDEDVIERVKEALSRESVRGTEMQSLSSPVWCVQAEITQVWAWPCVCRTQGELDVNRGTSAAEVIFGGEWWRVR